MSILSEYGCVKIYKLKKNPYTRQAYRVRANLSIDRLLFFLNFSLCKSFNRSASFFFISVRASLSIDRLLAFSFHHQTIRLSILSTDSLTAAQFLPKKMWKKLISMLQNKAVTTYI